MNPGDPPFDFHFGQDKVEEISRLKWDKPSCELIKSNNQYCLGSIFKEYAGLPEDYPLRLTMEHSIHIGDWSSNVAKKTIADAILTASTLPPPIINRAPETRPIPVGFGYLYAKALFKKFGLAPVAEKDRKGTLVFPFKVIRTAILHFDHAEYAALLKDLPDKYQPVYACIYYRNVPEIAHLYRDAGIPVVSAGHRFDPLFYHRFHDLCRRFRYSASNEFGTNLFLSVEDGCRFFFLDGPEVRREVTEKTDPGNRAGEAFENNRAEARRLFDEPVDEVTPEQKEFVDGFTGVNNMVSPRKLRHILLQEQRRFENRPWWHGKRKLFAAPDASHFTWQEFPAGFGWEGLEKDGDIRIRWIEPVNHEDEAENKAWVDLQCPRHLHKCDLLLKCKVHASACKKIEISVNGTRLTELDRTPNEPGFFLEGTVPGNLMSQGPAKGLVRIGFHTSGADVNSPHPENRECSAAISQISLSPKR